MQQGPAAGQHIYAEPNVHHLRGIGLRVRHIGGERNGFGFPFGGA